MIAVKIEIVRVEKGKTKTLLKTGFNIGYYYTHRWRRAIIDREQNLKIKGFTFSSNYTKMRQLPKKKEKK